MENAEILASLLKQFRRGMNSDRDVARFYARCRDGTATYKDAYAFADKTGKMMTQSIRERILAEYPNGIPPEAIDEIVPTALREQCKTVLAGSEQVQGIVNKKAKIGLSPVDIDLDEDRILGLAEHFKESGITDEALELITNLSKSNVDETIRENAEFQNDSGLVITVTRIYDDVGLNDGKEQCQWCLDRCGENVPYAEAFDRGMFERHPGCGCTLLYHVGKSTKIQTDWTKNKWEDTDDVLKMRKTIGL